MNERITAAQIARIWQLDGERTAGPWTVEQDDFGVCDESDERGGWFPVAINGGDGTPVIARGENSEGFWNEDQPEGDVAHANAAFIAAAANLIIPALDEIGRLMQAIRAIQLVAHEGLWGNDDEMQAALELIERHCAIAAPTSAEEGATE